MTRFVAAVGVSIFFASTSSLAEVSEQATAAMNAEFQAIDQSGGVNFEIVQDKFGDARSIIGKYDVGLDSTTSFDPVAVAGAVADFVSAHGAA